MHRYYVNSTQTQEVHREKGCKRYNLGIDIKDMLNQQGIEPQPGPTHRGKMENR